MKNTLLAAAAVILLLTAAAPAQPSGRSLTAKQKIAAIKAHKQAVHVKEEGWIRDPYITLGPDGKYYLTGTTFMPGDPKEASDPYNTGLGDTSRVGNTLQVWRSADLAQWEYLGAPYKLTEDGSKAVLKEKRLDRLWAPELHWADTRWALVHCPQNVSCLALTQGADVARPWTHPNPAEFKGRHDPSLFMDDDGTWYLIYSNTMIVPVQPGFAGLAGEPVRIDPSDRVIGHEGATIKKIGGKYVHFGTAWSTDIGRKGSYNLYYCTADKVTGPYSERRFAGRFLGHGTPFRDKAGNWWCTAFFNGNVPPLPREGIEGRDLGATAQTINPQGTTIVPLEVKILPDGDVWIRAIDPAYRNPGPEEVQKFAPAK